MDIKTIYVDAAPNLWEQIIEDKENMHYVPGKNYFKKIKGSDGHRYAIVDERFCVKCRVKRHKAFMNEFADGGVVCKYGCALRK